MMAHYIHLSILDFSPTIFQTDICGSERITSPIGLICPEYKVQPNSNNNAQDSGLSPRYLASIVTFTLSSEISHIIQIDE